MGPVVIWLAVVSTVSTRHWECDHHGGHQFACSSYASKGSLQVLQLPTRVQSHVHEANLDLQIVLNAKQSK